MSRVLWQESFAEEPELSADGTMSDNKAGWDCSDAACEFIKQRKSDKCLVLGWRKRVVSPTGWAVRECFSELFADQDPASLHANPAGPQVMQAVPSAFVTEATGSGCPAKFPGFSGSGFTTRAFLVHAVL